MAAIVLACFLSACGDSDPEETGQLVELQNKLKAFPDDNGQGEGLLIDSRTTIGHGGHGELESPGLFKGSRGFEVTPEELDRLEGTLASLDFAQLERAYTAGPDDGSMITLTYEGETVTVGDSLIRKTDVGEGEGEISDVLRPNHATRFIIAVGLINSFDRAAIPQRITDDLETEQP